MPPAPDNSAFTIAWICKPEVELPAACLSLTEIYDGPVSKPASDTNSYILGKIAGHLVVITALPYGKYGTTPAAIVAADLRRTFPNIKMGLLVGLGGGTPTAEHDIRLGDVVVSIPGPSHGGVIQYDFGRDLESGFETTGHLNAPPTALLTAIGSLQRRYRTRGHDLSEDIQRRLQDQRQDFQRAFGRPPLETDLLAKPQVPHVAEQDGPCPVCCNVDSDARVQRRDRNATEDDDDDDPAIFFGLVASANCLMNNALTRDRLARTMDVLCFETEAAGVMDVLPCLVVKGICDYSDSHKNKLWHGYAAMTAAAYATDLLGEIDPNSSSIPTDSNNARDRHEPLGTTDDFRGPLLIRGNDLLQGQDLDYRNGDHSAAGAYRLERQL